MLDIRCRRKRVRRDSAHHTAVRDIFSLQQKQQAVKVIRRKAASAPCTYSPTNRIRVKYAEKESYRLSLLLQMFRGLCMCLSVCVSAEHNREPYKSGWTDRDAVWDVDSIYLY